MQRIVTMARLGAGLSVGLGAALGMVLALGGCKGGEKQQGAGNAQGQILPGSTSDAMLPLDTVRSQAPLAPRAAAAADSAADAEATAAAADDAAPAAPTNADKAAVQQ